MPKKKAFTLVELLVVISIIALLLAILMPSLQKARENGRRIVCLTHLKSLQLSNDVYANTNNGRYVPLVDISTVPAGPASINYDNVDTYTWLANLAFRKITGVKSAEKSGTTYSNSIVLPDKFFCPSDEIAKKQIKSDKNVLVSFGYNAEDWWGRNATLPNTPNTFPASISKTPYGHRQQQIKTPSQKLIFVDSVDWWAIWAGASYALGWDKVGQKQREYYAAVGVVGPVLYRHSEGANIAFYDGHSVYLKKGKVFINGNPSAPLRAGVDLTGMWSMKNK